MVAPCYHQGVVKPTYSLTLIKGLIRDSSWLLTGSARDTATALGFDDEDVSDCIVNHLEETHFYKTMQAETRRGLMQDVYYITYQGIRLYVKLQVNVQAVVISFKAAE